MVLVEWKYVLTMLGELSVTAPLIIVMLLLPAVKLLASKDLVCYIYSHGIHNLFTSHYICSYKVLKSFPMVYIQLELVRSFCRKWSVQEQSHLSQTVLLDII